MNLPITHHVKPFRNRQLGRSEMFDLVMYKYIRLEYVLNMLETRILRFANIKKWEDVYENFVGKENIIIRDAKRRVMPSFDCFGQSWTTLEESDAMWRIYSDDGYAVKVKTAYPLLNKVLLDWNTRHEDDQIWPLTDYVFYADEKEINEWLVLHSPMNYWAFIELQGECLFIKRREFEHEKEIRVIFRDYKRAGKEYIGVDFDPNQFFLEIVIDPRVSEKEFIRQRDSLVARGFESKRIRKSTLYDFKKVELVVDMEEPCDAPIIVYEDGKPIQKYVPIGPF